jgi:hypothetical protein
MNASETAIPALAYPGYFEANAIALVYPYHSEQEFIPASQRIATVSHFVSRETFVIDFAPSRG